MASKSIQILVNEFPAWSDSAAWVAPTSGTQSCSLCAQRSYTPLTVHRLGRALCAGDAAGCKPAGHTGPKAYVPRVVILSREDGEGPLIARVRSSRLRVSSSFARFGMARECQVQARCEGEWELTNEMMITQKSLCDSIPVGGVTSFRMTTGGDYGTLRLGSSLKYAQKAGRFVLTVSTPSSF